MQNSFFFVTRILAVSCLLMLPGHSAAAPATAAAQGNAVPAAQAVQAVPLNQTDIHAAYNEGDFDKVTTLIDAFTKANKTYTRTDSIFIAKHLAVVYSANPQSREKGRYFMYRLLEMMPSAELVDMFVSDEIDRIFDKVRKEFISRQKSFGVDSTQISTPEKASTGSSATAATAAAKPGPASNGTSSEYLSASQSDKQPVWKKNGFWIAGGVGLVVAGTAAYFIYTQDEPTGKTIVIPASAQVR